MFYSFAKNLLKIVLSVFYRFNVTGLENVPPMDKLIICSNHASNWDPVFISIVFILMPYWLPTDIQPGNRMPRRPILPRRARPPIFTKDSVGNTD